MGVSGAGKSLIGGILAQRLGGTFFDADDLHSEEARAKMAAGTPLTDDDRLPWLVRVGERIVAERDASRRAVVACSALRRCYRDTIRDVVASDIVFVCLDGDVELIAERIDARQGHFMPSALLESQLATLERLEPDETGFEVPVAEPPEQIVARIVDRL